MCFSQSQQALSFKVGYRDRIHSTSSQLTVANAKFSLLKLLIYEPYYCYALVGWSARPRLEPLRAIGTLEPFLGHLALGQVATPSCIYNIVCWTTDQSLGTEFPLSSVYTV